MLNLLIIMGLICVVLPVKYDPAFYFQRKRWAKEAAERERELNREGA